MPASRVMCCEKWTPGILVGIGVELAADLGRGVRLGIERLVVRRPAVHPDQDAARRPLRGGYAGCPAGPQPQHVDEAAAGQHAQAQLAGSRGGSCRAQFLVHGHGWPCSVNP